jgi:hypothetical protein
MDLSRVNYWVMGLSRQNLTGMTKETLIPKKKRTWKDWWKDCSKG